MTTATTAELVKGVKLRLPGNLVRTVDQVVKSEYLNRQNKPIFYVMYEEGRTPEWGAGNSGIDTTVWTLA